MKSLTTLEKKKILSRLFWDTEARHIDFDELIDEKIRTIESIESQQFFCRLLASCDWYTILKLMAPAKVNSILTTTILNRLFPKDLKDRYLYAQKILSRKTLPISGRNT